MYRRLLAGGTAPLRLTYRDGAAVLGCGLVTSLAGLGWSGAAGHWSVWGALALTLGNAFTGLTLAAIASRWLGGRVGMMAGVAQVSTVYVLMPNARSYAGPLVSLAVCTAIGAFASAEVPGCVPATERRIHFGILCGAAAAAALVGGMGGPACILTICLGYLALFQDPSGLRFFTARLRPVILTLCIAAPCLAMRVFGVPGPHGLWNVPTLKAIVPAAPPMGIADAALWTSIQMLPWTPLALVAVAVGLRRGDYAAPFGRLVAAWLLAPWALWAAGALPAELALAAFAPCVAMTAAIGLSGLKWRKRAPPAAL